MFDRTRYTLAAIMAAFTLSGCEKGDPFKPPLDLCPDIPGDQISLPCVNPQDTAYSLKSVMVTVETATVIEGDSFSLDIRVNESNSPTNSTYSVTITLGGKTFQFGTLGSHKVEASVVPGTYTGTVRVCNTTAGRCAETSVSVTVKPKPNYIVTTCIEGSYPDRGAGEVCMAEDTTNAKVVRLTATGGSKAFSAVSPDLSYVLYVLWEDRSLWRAKLDGGNATRYQLVWQGKKLYPLRIDISPTGQKFAFMAVIEGESTYSAFVMNVDGTGLKRLLEEKNTPMVPDLAWMPNGQEVVLGYNVIGYVNDTVGTGALQKVYALQNVVTDEVKTLLTTDRGEEMFGLSIMDSSPVGDLVMLWDDFSRTTNPLGVFLLRTDGSGEVKVVPGAVWVPIFCPNGREVCSIKKINGGRVVSMDFNGQNVQDRFTVGSGWIDRLYRVNVVR